MRGLILFFCDVEAHRFLFDFDFTVELWSLLPSILWPFSKHSWLASSLSRFFSSFLSMSGFYRADVFPVTPPTVLKCWRKSVVLTKTGGLASVFFVCHWTHDRRGVAPFTVLHSLYKIPEICRL